MRYCASFLLIGLVTSMARAGMTINEFHYDNAGTDIGEFVEVVTDPGQRTDVVNGEVIVILYNGADGQPYDGILNLKDFMFHGTLADGMDYYSRMTAGLQNGSPDGLALTHAGAVVEFLSYEGIFTATAGLANGLTSTDIGVAELSSAPVGSSLQRVNFSSQWVLIPGTNTQGCINTLNAIPSPGTLGLVWIGLVSICMARSLQCRAGGEGGSPYITAWEHSPRSNLPTDSVDEAD